MKNIICLVLIMVFLFIPMAAISESSDDNIYFDVPLLNHLNRKSSEWFASAEDRALLTILTLVELPEDTPIDKSQLMANNSYVGKIKDQPVLSIIGYDDNYIIFIIYSPMLSTAAYTTANVVNPVDDFIEVALKRSCESYYKNDVEDIVRVSKMVLDAIDQ